MFNFSGSEMVFLLLLALIILGPEKLPDAIRKFTQTYGEFKKAATGFQTELKSALDEPMREMKATADELKKAATFDTSAAPAAPAAPPVAEPSAEPAGDAPPTLSPFQSADAFSAAPPIRPAPPRVPMVPDTSIDEPVSTPDDDVTTVLPVLETSDPVVPEPIVPEPVLASIVPEPIVPEPIVPEPIVPEPVVASIVPEPTAEAEPVTPALPPLPRTRVLSARPAPSLTVPPPPPPPAGDAPPFAAVPAWPQPAAAADQTGTDETTADEGSSPA